MLIGVFGAAKDLTNDQLAQMIVTNLTAAFHMTCLVVPYLRHQGGGRLMQLSHVLIGAIVWWLESEKTYTLIQMAAVKGGI